MARCLLYCSYGKAAAMTHLPAPPPRTASSQKLPSFEGNLICKSLPVRLLHAKSAKQIETLRDLSYREALSGLMNRVTAEQYIKKRLNNLSERVNLTDSRRASTASTHTVGLCQTVPVRSGPANAGTGPVRRTMAGYRC